MKWLARVQALNPHDAYGFLRYGMCLDRLDRHEEAEKYFNRAEALDPNGYYTVALVGWHYVQTGDYAAALPWFVRSLDLEHNENDVAVAYRDIAWQRLAEQASGQRPIISRWSLPPTWSLWVALPTVTLSMVLSLASRFLPGSSKQWSQRV